MKKSIKLIAIALIVAMLSVAVLALVACDDTPTPKVHNWGIWQHDGEEHFRYCRDDECYAEERGEHNGQPCVVCAYGFRVLAFGFDEGGDTAHSDFAKEANVWFPEKGEELGFSYHYVGADYSHLNDENLENYDMIVFLNDRPWTESQQAAFQRFIENGGAWMGFHSAAFSMRELGGYWKWYQEDFLGCGDYAKNTWNPTSEPLTIYNHDHPATQNIEEDYFISAPCEWYGWEFDLFANDDISVLLTLNPTQDNPAGDQPDKSKPHEIWYDGCHPIAWANNNYNMVYMNWGHNLQSYNNGAEGTKSSTFSSELQNQFMLDSMFGLVQNQFAAKYARSHDSEK